MSSGNTPGGPVLFPEEQRVIDQARAIGYEVPPVVAAQLNRLIKTDGMDADRAAGHVRAVLGGADFRPFLEKHCVPATVSTGLGAPNLGGVRSGFDFTAAARALATKYGRS
jgi:hypothetical protein